MLFCTRFLFLEISFHLKWQKKKYILFLSFLFSITERPNVSIFVFYFHHNGNVYLMSELISSFSRTFFAAAFLIPLLISFSIFFPFNVAEVAKYPSRALPINLLLIQVSTYASLLSNKKMTIYFRK